MALRTSWLARPPTAAANGGRVPLAVLDRQLTNSVFTRGWEESQRKGNVNTPVCMKSSVRESVFLCSFKRKSSLCSWELHSLPLSALVKPQHPVNTWWHQRKTAAQCSVIVSHREQSRRLDWRVIKKKYWSNTEIWFTQCWGVCCAAPGRHPAPTWQRGCEVGPEG